MRNGRKAEDKINNDAKQFLLKIAKINYHLSIKN